MNRRLFLRHGGLAGVALSALPLHACISDPKDAPATQATGAPAAAPAAAAFALHEATVAD